MELIVKAYGTGYGPRTALNAKSADLTVAFAVNFASAGERLTKKVSVGHYLGVQMPFSPRSAAHQIAAFMREHSFSSLNIAGNGIYTLNDHHYSQENTNQLIYETLGIVHSVRPISKIVSGGQTGVDMAGAVAAVALGIDATITFPYGFLQRDIHGVDAKSTAHDRQEAIMRAAEHLNIIDHWPTPLTKRVVFF